MLFTSLAFLVFLTGAAFVFHRLPLRWRGGGLLIASYGYYCSWSPPFALLLLGVAGVALLAARRIQAEEREERRRRLMVLSVLALFLPLLVFRYLSGIGADLAASLGGAGWASSLRALTLLAPIGISYYTFKLVSYVLDVYWGRLEASHGFVQVANYAGFFPQIVSGPVQRAGDFLAQVTRFEPVSTQAATAGLRLILFGLFQKLVVADKVAGLVDQVYASPEAFPPLASTVATYLLTVQWYADFSGLTDIAIGAALLLGIKSPPNFDAPLYAENIQEFWRRWHMSLTSWVRDYVFLPLRMSLRNFGELGLFSSLLLNMLAVGLWHGPRPALVVFGLLHGLFLYVSVRTWKWRSKLYSRNAVLDAVHRLTGPLTTFHLVVITLPLFKTTDTGQAVEVVLRSAQGLASLPPAFLAGTPLEFGDLAMSGHQALAAAVAIVVMETIHVLQHRGQTQGILARAPTILRWAGYYAMVLAILLWGEFDSRPFIYVAF
jgi:hypothetical protein